MLPHCSVSFASSIPSHPFQRDKLFYFENCLFLILVFSLSLQPTLSIHSIIFSIFFFFLKHFLSRFSRIFLLSILSNTPFYCLLLSWFDSCAFLLCYSFSIYLFCFWLPILPFTYTLTHSLTLYTQLSMARNKLIVSKVPLIQIFFL